MSAERRTSSAADDWADQGPLLPRGGSGSRGWVLAAAVLIVVAVAVVYANSFWGKFFFDDHFAIVNNRKVHRLWPLWDVLKDVSARGMRPVALLSLAVNWKISGDQEWSYHAVNLGIHLAAALLLFGIVRRTLASPRVGERLNRVSLPLGLAIALIWAVHPLHTQSVTYIVQRAESMMGMFYLLTLYGAIRAMGSRRPILWGAVATVACALGMGTKQVAVTAPLMVVIHDALFAPWPFARTLRRRWGLYGALAATWGVLGLLWWLTPPFRSAGFGYPVYAWWQYPASQFGVIAHYLRLAFWPDRLSLDYGWPAIAWPAWSSSRYAYLAAKAVLGVALPGALIAGLIAMTIWAFRRHRWTGFWGAWFFLILAPTSSIMPIADLAVEHRMYLPLAAVVAVTVIAAFLAGRALLERVMSVARDRRDLGRAVAAVLVLAAAGSLGARTVYRNTYYHDEERMWRDVIDQNPRHYRGHDSLGVALAKKKRYKEAIAEHRRALELNPSHAEAYNNLGVALSNTPGGLAEAIACFGEAIRLRPRHARAHCNLGNALSRQGRLVEAETACRRAIELKSDYAIGYGALAEVLEKQGRLDEAERYYRGVLEFQPRRVMAYVGLANVFLKRGDVDTALTYCDKALEIDSGKPEAHNVLARVFQRQGDMRAAAQRYGLSLTYQADNVFALNNLAWLRATCPIAQLRDGAAAVELSRRACELTQFKDPTALDTLAAAYAEAGDFDRAVATAEQAIATATEPRYERLRGACAARLELYRARKPFRKAGK